MILKYRTSEENGDISFRPDFAARFCAEFVKD